MKRIAVICALAAPTFALAAADDVGHWYLTPQIGGISVDNDRPLEDKDWLYALAFGKHVNQGLSIELNVDGAQIGGGPGRGDESLYGTSLNFLGVMNRSGKVSPYVTAGLGVLSDERSPGRNATDAMAQAGLGLMMTAWESADGSSSFSFRPELKARWDDAGAAGHLVDYIGTLGFQYSWGAARPVPVVLAPPPPPPPAPEPMPPPPPGDSDHDGVTDDIDKCPGTPAGVAVDSVGCPLKGSITIEGVTFELNSAQLTSESLATLDTMAANLKKYPRLQLELQGHTDSTGTDKHNLTLSQQRANSVQAHLVGQGVPASRLVARGYGEAQPIDDNKTDAGRARNRRVVMLVVSNPGDVKIEGEGTVEK